MYKLVLTLSIPVSLGSMEGYTTSSKLFFPHILLTKLKLFDKLGTMLWTEGFKNEGLSAWKVALDTVVIRLCWILKQFVQLVIREFELLRMRCMFVLSAESRFVFSLTPVSYIEKVAYLFCLPNSLLVFLLKLLKSILYLFVFISRKVSLF